MLNPYTLLVNLACGNIFVEKRRNQVHFARILKVELGSFCIRRESITFTNSLSGTGQLATLLVHRRHKLSVTTHIDV